MLHCGDMSLDFTQGLAQSGNSSQVTVKPVTPNSQYTIFSAEEKSVTSWHNRQEISAKLTLSLADHLLQSVKNLVAPFRRRHRPGPARPLHSCGDALYLSLQNSFCKVLKIRIRVSLLVIEASRADRTISSALRIVSNPERKQCWFLFATNGLGLHKACQGWKSCSIEQLICGIKINNAPCPSLCLAASRRSLRAVAE